MLVDPNKKTEAFNPNVDNTTYNAQASGGDSGLWWFLYILAWLTIVGGIILTIKWYGWGNELRRKQNEINQAASAIDINQVKRKDTLIKLVEQVKAQMNFEKNTLENITKLRSLSGSNSDINKINDNEKIMNSISKAINVNFENYPNLKSSSAIAELMSSSQYIEAEISASRRLYNTKVTDFNQLIVSFPISVKAKSMRCHSLPLFAASEEDKKDVKMDSLSKMF
ncbi:LemA family protein [Mycoplasma bradburyae]|uniref:LemA family protein n=1 Tax=Mycoplasma bradburyae TaxID=2963128 RepID=A0AAW6HNP3_9MOLU|nr:LemA family protein [Mycoplasma bradburyae]MDC4182717.1 LemA family protein [Mycoplasma bradburyae]MDC4183390.1 LemA family protein [Mycoplasma bradburyae]UTS71163.1 LemA family protein [Mycoplasma bradburyae]